MSTSTSTSSTSNDKSLTPGASGWDSCAERYALEAVHVTMPPAVNALKEGMRILGQADNVRVGDIACGSGCVTQAASQLNPVSAITACDYSQGMVDIVTRENKSSKDKSITAFVADAADLSAISTGSIDIAVMSFALMLLPPASRDRAAAEMVRIVRPGGIVAFTTWVEPDKSQFHSVVCAVNRNRAKLAQDRAAKADPTAASTPPAPTNAQAMKLPYSTFDSFTELFASLSLKPELLTTFTAPVRMYDGLDDFGSSIRGISPVGFQIGDDSEAEFRECIKPLAAIFGQHSKFSLHATSILAIGRKQ